MLKCTIKLAFKGQSYTVLTVCHLQNTVLPRTGWALPWQRHVILSMLIFHLSIFLRVRVTEQQDKHSSPFFFFFTLASWGRAHIFPGQQVYTRIPFGVFKGTPSLPYSIRHIWVHDSLQGILTRYEVIWSRSSRYCWALYPFTIITLWEGQRKDLSENPEPKNLNFGQAAFFQWDVGVKWPESFKS